MMDIAVLSDLPGLRVHVSVRLSLLVLASQSGALVKRTTTPRSTTEEDQPTVMARSS